MKGDALSVDLVDGRTEDVEVFSLDVFDEEGRRHKQVQLAVLEPERNDVFKPSVELVLADVVLDELCACSPKLLVILRHEIRFVGLLKGRRWLTKKHLHKEEKNGRRGIKQSGKPPAKAPNGKNETGRRPWNSLKNDTKLGIKFEISKPRLKQREGIKMDSAEKQRIKLRRANK